MTEKGWGNGLFYDTHVFCCVNERPAEHPRSCCSARGSIPLHAYMNLRAKKLNLGERVRINRVGCLDRCELGPTMVIYPEGVWYTYKSREDIDEILDSHISRGVKVERLVLPPDLVPEKPTE